MVRSMDLMGLKMHATIYVATCLLFALLSIFQALASFPGRILGTRLTYKPAPMSRRGKSGCFVLLLRFPEEGCLQGEPTVEGT